MNDDDQDAEKTLEFTAQDTEILPWDDGLETVQENALPADDDDDPTSQIAISGEITL